MRREEQWNTWKNDGCQALISPKAAAAAKNADKAAATTLGGINMISVTASAPQYSEAPKSECLDFRKKILA